MVDAEYLNGDMHVAVKYGLIKYTILPAKEKKKKKEQKQKKTKKSKKKKTKVAKKTFKEKLDTAQTLYDIAKIAVDSAKKPLKRLFKKLKIYDVELYVKVGGDDAEKVANNFSKMNMFLHTLYSFCINAFTVKIKQIYVEPDFVSCEHSQVAKVKISMRPSTILAIAFGFAFRFGYKFLKSRIKNNKEKQIS